MELYHYVPSSSACHQASLFEAFQEAKRQQITSHLSSIVQAFMEITDLKDIQPHAPIWSHFAPNFKCEGEGPALKAIFVGGGPSVMTLDQFMESREQIAIQFPAHWARITNISVCLSDQERRAQVYAYVEVNGLPERTVRPIVTVFDFVLFAAQRGREGRWRVARLRRLPGMEIDGGI